MNAALRRGACCIDRGIEVYAIYGGYRGMVGAAT
jgi:hypothetical protein